MTGHPILACLVALAAFNSFANGAEPPYELTGTILDATTKAPLADAYVLAIYEESFRDNAVSANHCAKVKGMYTGPDGKFRFPVEKLNGISPGMVQAIKP